MTNQTASQCHTRTQKSQYVQSMTKNEILHKINKIADEMKQSWEINDGHTSGYDELSRKRGDLQNAYNKIEREEMKVWKQEQEDKRQKALLLRDITTNNYDDDDRPNTFGDFEAEWDAEAWF